MSTKKKTDKNKDERFVVKKRTPKEKPNYFQNIPSFKDHPLADILNFPAQQDQQSNASPQNTGTEPETGNHSPVVEFLESSLHPEHNDLDTQNQHIGHPDDKTLDTQDKISGHPDINNLSANTPETPSDTPRKANVLDTPTPKSKTIIHSKNENWRKYDKKRATVRVNIHISKEINKKVRQFCMVDSEPRMELKEFYEAAAAHYLNFLDTQNIKNLGAGVHLDDRRLKILFRTRPFIINLYLRYNAIFNEISGDGSKGKWSGRWMPRDDEAAQRYNEVDPRIIELGIIQTQTNKGIGQGKIQTFKYYTEEIEKVLASGVSDELIGHILDYHRQIWKSLTNREIDLSFLEESTEK